MNKASEVFPWVLRVLIPESSEVQVTSFHVRHPYLLFFSYDSFESESVSRSVMSDSATPRTVA